MDSLRDDRFLLTNTCSINAKPVKQECLAVTAKPQFEKTQSDAVDVAFMHNHFCANLARVVKFGMLCFHQINALVSLPKERLLTRVKLPAEF